MKYEFLHISKTGGTALNEVLEDFGDKIRKRGHKFTLAEVPEDASAVFVVREPVDRFVSGFNSRLRKGMPRRRLKWSPAEKIAFERFSTANLLAEALSGSDEERAAAQAAMDGIMHSSLRLTYTLGSLSAFESHKHRIAWIGHQPTLTADFEVLKTIIGLPADAHLPTDPVRSHATPEGYDTTLSERGRANLAEWYKDDYPVYSACLALREELMQRADAGS